MIRVAFVWGVLAIACGDQMAPPSDAAAPPDDGSAELTVNSTSFDLGVIPIGSTPRTATFVVTNIGDGTSAPLEAHLDNTDANELQLLVGACANRLAPAQACELVLTFTAKDVGAKTGRIIVTAGSLEVSATITASTGIAHLTPSPFSFDFEAIHVDATAAQTYTITNDGTLDTGELTTTLIPFHSDNLTIAATTCSSLAVGESCTVDVGFQPSHIGAQYAQVSIAGTIGVSVTTVVYGIGTTDAFGIAPNPAYLGSAQLGHRTDPLVLHVRNTTSVPGQPLATSLDGPDAASIGIVADTCAGVALAPDSSCTISVDCGPLTIGTLSATLHVTASTGDGSTPLQCNGFN